MASVFISHSSADIEFVRQLAADLRTLGHDPWVDEDEIQVGDSIHSKIAAAIGRCDFVAIVLSHTATNSGWVKEEWQAKYWDQVTDKRTLVLPILKDRCDVPMFLKDKMYADFCSSYGVGLVRLTKAIDQLLRPSPLTPDTRLLNELVNTYIEALCRAVSLPGTPAQLKLRVFVFRTKDRELVCRYFWAQDQVEEMVGRTRFALDEETSKSVVVVRAALTRRISRAAVDPLPKDAHGVTGEVDADLKYIIAAPIMAGDNDIWGTVDFDSSTDEGARLLSREEASSAIYRFSKHLQIIFTGQYQP